jgi:hypothetical protein
MLTAGEEGQPGLREALAGVYCEGLKQEYKQLFP